MLGDKGDGRLPAKQSGSVFNPQQQSAIEPAALPREVVGQLTWPLG